MFNREGKLEIFENFRMDGDLPKFWKNHKRGGGRYEKTSDEQMGMKDYEVSSKGEAMMQQGFSSVQSFNQMQVGSRLLIQNQQFNAADSDSEEFVLIRQGVKEVLPWWKKLFRVKPKQQPEDLKDAISIEEFFTSIKNSQVELSIVKERAQGYEKQLKNALHMGQTALFERLKLTIESVRNEAQLFAMGQKKYIEEATLVEFVKKAKKGLRLDYVGNFTRTIPGELLKLKMELDEKDIFDNYVVLHYDPQGKSWSQTEAEKEAERARRRDPIMFGILAGRRRLYYVGDWTDEYCDLTLDQIADTIGKEAILEVS